MDKTNRFKNGREAEHAVLKQLMFSGVHYVITGQEMWLPKEVHDKVRLTHENPYIDAIRHFPDFSTHKLSIQVKAAPDADNYPTVTIEQASYNVSRALSDCGWPVLIVWVIGKPDAGNIYGQWASKITPQLSQKAREDLNGSHTPMYLVRKNQLQPFKQFLDYL